MKISEIWTNLDDNERVQPADSEPDPKRQDDMEMGVESAVVTVAIMLLLLLPTGIVEGHTKAGLNGGTWGTATAPDII
ncbi:hypothetical protein CFP56_007538 [Quercus suber]|uniref:Uncharacterized protein n=1 Tax=Quercus suber TaxID=58331 RepID=A0AAW0L4X9_QUESU